MNRKIITLIIAMAVSVQTMAQDKKLTNIKQLFQSEKYDECIEAAKKYNSANNQKPDGYFYLALSYYGLYKKNPQKESSLSFAENTMWTAFNKDKSKTVREDFKDNIDELHNTMVDVQTKFFTSGDVRRAQSHGEMTARIFGDTTDIYRQLITPKPIEPKTYGKTLAAYEGPTNQTDVTGKKMGVWIENFPNGNRKSQINYEAGKPKGDFYKFYENGGVKAHLYFIDDNRAAAILYQENGDKIAMGYYYNQQKDSLWQYFESDSLLVLEENYVKGVKNGVETTYFIFGFPAEELTWKNGVKNGPWKRYHESGSLHFVANYVDGKLQGRYEKYDIKGTLEVVGNYKDDVKHGEWKEYDPETKKYISHKYINGKLENANEVEIEESNEIEKTTEQGKNLPDPKNYSGNPEDFFMNGRQ